MPDETLAALMEPVALADLVRGAFFIGANILVASTPLLPRPRQGVLLAFSNLRRSSDTLDTVESSGASAVTLVALTAGASLELARGGAGGAGNASDKVGTVTALGVIFEAGTG